MSKQGSKASGGFILTASHNPGGPNEVRTIIYVLLNFNETNELNYSGDN